MIRLFKVFIPTSVLALLTIELVLVTASYLAALFWLMAGEYEPYWFLTDEHGWARILFVTLVIILGLYFNDLYTKIRVRSRSELLQQLCVTIGLAFFAQALVSYFRRDLTLPKWMMIEGSTFALAALFLTRLAFARLIIKTGGLQRILFMGRSPIVFEVADHLVSHPEIGVYPIGYLDEVGLEALEPHALPQLGRADDVVQVVRSHRPNQIVVGMTERRSRMPAEDLLHLRFSGINVIEIATLYESTFGRVCTREIRPSHLIFTEGLGPRSSYIRFQLFYSRLLATVGILVSLPLIALVALAVKLTSAGPVLFRQQRVGLGEKTFTVFKFRSMYQDAEAKTGPIWASPNDPRITPLGYWLRRLRLDELPQLFNVLRGEMSLVGPRPERPEFVSTLNSKILYYRQRHSVLPGITGWAQVNYKYGDTIEDTIFKLEYDLYYIKNMSIALDCVILFHTVKTMLLSRGAQ